MYAEDLLLHNKYSLVKGAARRARQLQSGAPPLGVSKSMKACRVAQDEINAGQGDVHASMAKKRTPPPSWICNSLMSVSPATQLRA